MSKSLTLVSIAVSLLSLGALAITQLKPYDEKAETAVTRKAIEARYAQLADAIFNANAEKADEVTHDNFSMIPALAGEISDEYVEDEADYIASIEENDVILSVQKARSDEDSKIDRKITSFIAGRRLASATYVETMNGEFVDTEGEFGEKGKTRKLETIAVFHDQWYLGVSSDKDEPDWYLFDREATSITFKLDGKPFDPPVSDGSK